MTEVITNRKEKSSGISPIYIIGALFFVFGFVTWLNSVLILYLRIACQLNNFESYLVVFAFYIAYLVMGVPSSWVLAKTGFKNGMAVGLLIMAIGALIFIPAALTRMYPLFLTGLFVLGTGMTILQTASNPYITILGPIESAAKRISIMGIFNKVAGSIAPIILGAMILTDADGIKARLLTMTSAQKEIELNMLSHRVILPYVVILIVLVLLAVFVYYSTLPEVEAQKDDDTAAPAESAQTSIFQFPHLLVGVLALFLYVGVEVMAGDSVISYASSQGIPSAIAKYFTTCTLICMIAGYIVGIICIPKYFTQQKALKVSAFIGVLCSLGAIFTSGYTSVLFVSLLGIANALMWPALWPLAINGLGKFTKIGSSLLIMGIAGGAVIPLLYGFIVDKLTTGGQLKNIAATEGYWILVPCYVVIAYFAIAGHKLKPKTI
ncbi:sugar MFS transporter [Mucilaginibacter sp. BJC16-A38]|uniref:sugar MFS transporter n=1 Tax=Mucilaginibacter phenanthrenivorans TaxID=1234842 RepID=UPI002157957B|nr:sugar MFS transporter [Mucilaginibacter phenanthrenivorans]MCR8557269.1 sugar MFS transporter [Mucilaginibacter phenanthrenivorans]